MRRRPRLLKDHIENSQIANGQIVQSFDLILANIHRNILLSQLSLYAQLSKEVWLSGFYEQDAPVLIAAAEKVGLHVAFRRAPRGARELKLLWNLLSGACKPVVLREGHVN